MKSRPNRLPGRIFLLAAGLLLLLYGAVTPLLPFIGQRASGEITTVRRELGERSDPLPNRYSYSVGYEFTLPDGRVIHGNTKVIGSSFNSGIAKGKAGVLYLPGLPWVNALERETRFDAGKIAILAAGAFLCFMAFRQGANSRTTSRKPWKLR